MKKGIENKKNTFEDYLIQQSGLLKKWWNKQGENLFLDWVYETQFYNSREIKIKNK